MRSISTITATAAFTAVLAVCSATQARQYMNNPNTDTGSMRALGRESLSPGMNAMAQLDSVQKIASYSPAQRQRLIDRTQQLIERSQTACDVQQAVSMGMTQRRQEMFEVSCASGMGFLVVGGSQVEVYDCLAIAQAAHQARTSDPRANVGSQCSLPENGGS